MAGASAGVGCGSCCLCSPPRRTFESMAVRVAPGQRGGGASPAAISSGGLLTPLGNLWSANSASPPSPRRGITDDQRFPSRRALSNARRTLHRGGEGGWPNTVVLKMYEQNRESQQQQPQQGRGPFPRPRVIPWEKDSVNAVQLVGRVGRDIQIKYLNSGKVVATTSLTLQKGSERSENPSWFPLEIWDDLAEIAAHHVAKGELVFVAGEVLLGEKVYHDFRSANVKVVVSDLYFVEPSNDRRQPFGLSNDNFTVRGSRSQSQAEVASEDLSRRNWNQQQLSSEPSQGSFARFRMHGKDVAQLEVQSPQARTGASKWTEAAMPIKQNRNHSHKVVGGIEDTGRRNISAHMDSADTTTQAIALLQNRLQRGLSTDSSTYIKVLQMCLKQKDISEAKQVHDCIIQSGMDKNLYVAGNLLNVYIKCGGLADARRVFDQLEKKSVVVWTIMISGYANSDHARSALELFNQMLQEGVKPNEITYLSILKACTRLLDLTRGKDIHESIRHAGFESDVRIGTTLLQMYAKCGCIAEARQVFEKLTNRNVVTWNVMIGGLAQYGCGHEAYRLFLQMIREGFEPGVLTYLSILNAGASAGALEWVKEVHVHLSKAGLESDLRVGSSLVHMYAASGSIDDARQVFDRMKKRDLVMWNIMIGGLAQHGCGHEAYQLFLQMRREGFEPDAVTYLSIFNAAASVGPIEWVKEVHDHASKAGLESDLRVGSALVHLYAGSGSIDDARQLFDRMEKRDVATWNVMIGGLAQHGCGHEAYQVFLQMRRQGFEPNAFTYASLLNAPASAGALELVKEVHGQASKAGLESDLRVGNALVHMYAETGSIDDARQVFDRMEKRDLVTWNVMIGGLAQYGCGHEAYRLFLQMRQEGYEPDAFTYVSILNLPGSAGALEWVKEVNAHVCKSGLESDMRVGTALVHMYAECGSIEDARQVFTRMEKRDVVTWNVMIGGLAQHGCGHEALALFRKMNADLVKPDGTTFVAVLSACCHGGLVDDGRRLFSAITQDYGIEPDSFHYACMVDLLGRAGHLEEARRFISDMPIEPGVVIWTALLGACRTYGDVELGELAANELFKLEPSKASTYVLLSNIYAATGKWEKVSQVRTLMQQRGVRKEPGRSWIDVDNKTHEFVVGDKSHPEAEAIYSELTKLTEKLKAEGYIPDTRLVLHDINEEDKELALCSHSEKLAIAYGLIHIPRGEPIRVEKNLRVCPDCHTATKLISKVTGREIIARDANRFHHFKDGVCSCGDYW